MNPGRKVKTGANALGDENDFQTNLAEKCREILRYHFQHREASLVMSRRADLLGIPVIILTTVVGTAVFSSVNENATRLEIELILGLLAISAAVLAALQRNMNFAEKAAKHKLTADEFGALKDELDNIRIQRDEEALEKFCLAYPDRKKILLKGTGSISDKVRRRAEELVNKQMQIRQADEEHRSAWNPFIERDRVYNDVEEILNLLEKKDGGRDFVFKMRRELNLIHLRRDPVMEAGQVKEILHEQGLFSAHHNEGEAWDENLTPAFVEAVMRYQRTYSLEQVDGIVGPHTKDKLLEQSAQYN